MQCEKCSQEILNPKHIYYPFDEVQIVETDDGEIETLQGTLTLCESCLSIFKENYSL